MSSSLVAGCFCIALYYNLGGRSCGADRDPFLARVWGLDCG